MCLYYHEKKLIVNKLLLKNVNLFKFYTKKELFAVVPLIITKKSNPLKQGQLIISQFRQNKKGLLA